MVTCAHHGIDFSTFPTGDGEPMAETETHRRQMCNTIFNLENLTAAHPRVYVGGNMMMYYNQASGWDHVSADVFVTCDVPRAERAKWETWKENGRFADVIVEVTSPSTIKEDLGKKRLLYARLSVQELYLYDPHQQVHPYFRGYRLVDGDLVELPAPANDTYYSPLLGTELRVMGQWLRVMDPATGEPFPLLEEVKAALRLAEQEQQREAMARQAAEERAAHLEAQNAADRAELARLRALLAEQHDQPE